MLPIIFNVVFIFFISHTYERRKPLIIKVLSYTFISILYYMVNNDINIPIGAFYFLRILTYNYIYAYYTCTIVYNANPMSVGYKFLHKYL